MASTADTKKATLAEVSKKLSADNPDIFNCDHERELFQGNFKLLVRTLVMDDSFPEFKQIKERRFRDVLSRAATKKFAIKAEATARPSMLKLAEECAVSRDQIEIDKEAVEELKGFKLSPQEMQKLLKVAMDKISKQT